ncbi:unnamed protein product [Cuscuta campestris]|uniref:BHLH domain-containing protein n=1 Tax=Cuscuta campestris TaxID=132261 RepID=A0A484M4S2_9ASTE|nr:unnamed protein product [Cuscuta campestris]
MAFKNNVPYLEVMLPDLERLASNEVQKQFYMVNMEMEMKTLFPEDFSRQAAATSSLLARWISSTPPLQPDPNLPSSSSSSLRSLSIDSPESLLFNVAATTSYPSVPPPPTAEAFSDHTAMRIHPPPAIQTLGQIRTVDFQSMQSEEAAIASAFLAVISSSSSFHLEEERFSRSSTAFRKYGGGARPSIQAIRKQSVLKRSIAFFRNLNWLRRQGLIRPASRHTTTQVHHMISERKRREKLNRSFQQLRSLLPPGTKKDKASVLSATTEKLTSLISQVEELRRRNQALEAAEMSMKTAASAREEAVASSASSSPTKVEVRLTSAGEAGTTTWEESSSSRRGVEVRVRVGGESTTGAAGLEVLVVRLMELLKEVGNVGLVSVQAHTTTTSPTFSSSSLHRIIFTLAIQGGEFDESSFLEAVRRVAADLFV